MGARTGRSDPGASDRFYRGPARPDQRRSAPYASREETRHEHLADLRRIYGYRSFSGRGARDLREWIAREAEAATSNEDLARRFVAECRRTRTILPASTIERFAPMRWSMPSAGLRIVSLDGSRRPWRAVGRLLEDTDGRVTRFVLAWQLRCWRELRRCQPADGSTGISSGHRSSRRFVTGVPPHGRARLRRQGERYYADGMRDLPEDRRLAILAVCTLEWRASLADAMVETHDRIVGRLYRASERLCSTRIADEKAAVRDTLKSFAEIGGACWGRRTMARRWTIIARAWLGAVREPSPPQRAH
jgi:hypothetical protein